MEDRELLELAAKAGAVDASWLCPDDKIEEHANNLAQTEGMWLKGARGPDNSAHWNPLLNDGDAMRLAAKLRMEIDHNHPADERPWISVRAQGARNCSVEEFDDECNRIGYARRAIVRAAAEIGRSMPD